MKTSKLLGLLIAFIMLISVSSCGPTYYNSRPRAYAGRRHYSPPRPAPRPYGGNYGYGRPGW